MHKWMFFFSWFRSLSEILHGPRGDKPFEEEINFVIFRPLSNARVLDQIRRCSQDQESCVQTLRGYL